MTPNSLHVAVLGAGPAGLFCAHELATHGFSVALFDAHSKPGGSASYFRRRVRGEGESSEYVVFDAGATVLNRLGSGEYLRARLEAFGVQLDASFEPLKTIRCALPGEPMLELPCATLETYIEALVRAFPQDAALLRGPLARLGRAAAAIATLADRGPHLPIENWFDLRADLALLPEFLRSGAVGAVTSAIASGLVRDFGAVIAPASPRLRRWIEMNLLITLQCRPEAAHPLYGALGLFFYAFGAGSLDGGMKSFFLPLLETLKAKANAHVFMRNAITAIDTDSRGRFLLRDANRTVGPFDAVFSSLPRYDTARLFPERTVDHAMFGFGELAPRLWSAFVGYYVIEDEAALPDEAFHVHASRAASADEAPDGGDVYLSFSRRGDVSKCPKGLRSLTTSTHVRLPTDRHFNASYDKAAKAAEGRSMLRWALDAAYPNLRVVFEEYGSPRTFHRYTRRRAGTVGGLPLNRDFALWHAPPQRTQIRNLYQIGDTAFPGQSVYACAVGARAAVDKFIGARR